MKFASFENKTPASNRIIFLRDSDMELDDSCKGSAHNPTEFSHPGEKEINKTATANRLGVVSL